MEVRHRSISAIAALADLLPWLNLITHLHFDAAEFEMSQERVLRVAIVNHHEVARGRTIERRVDGIIRDAVTHPNHRAVARSKDGPSETKVLLKLSTIA